MTLEQAIPWLVGLVATYLLAPLVKDFIGSRDKKVDGHDTRTTNVETRVTSLETRAAVIESTNGGQAKMIERLLDLVSELASKEDLGQMEKRLTDDIKNVRAEIPRPKFSATTSGDNYRAVPRPLPRNDSDPPKGTR